MSRIQVAVNAAGNGIDLLLIGAGIVEIEGELHPGIEMTPQCALDLAEALTECCAEIVEQ